MNNEETFIQFEEVKKAVADLENFTQTKMKAKVNELNEIVEHIQSNWRGANSEKYKKQITEINEAIDEFRTNCLAKIVENIDSQTGQYRNIENN